MQDDKEEEKIRLVWSNFHDAQGHHAVEIFSHVDRLFLSSNSSFPI